jgi:hypothetical protein
MRFPVSVPDPHGTAWQRFRCTPIWWMFVILCIPFEFFFRVYATGPISTGMVKTVFCAAISAVVLAGLYIAFMVTFHRARSVFDRFVIQQRH